MKIFPYKKYFISILAFLLVMSVTASYAATENKQNREIRAGIFNFDGYHSKDENGNLAGYGMDLLALLSEYSHLNFNFSGYENSWHDMQDMLKNGEIDVVSSARRTPEREEIFAFSLPVGRNHTMLSKQLYNTRLKAGDYSTYNGIKVGAVARSSQNASLEDFARKKGFKYTLIEYESPQELSEALQNGEVDAILSSNLRKPNNETLLDIIDSDNFYIIARKEDQDIIDEINYAIEQMNLNEGDWQNDIYYKHYGPAASAIPEFSKRENDYIEAVKNGEKKITAIARRDIPPYSYFEDGTVKGILPDFFDKAMSVAGLPYTIVSPDSRGNYQKSSPDEVNVVLDKLGSGLAPDKSSYVGFTTDPYLVTGLANVARVDAFGPVRSVGIPDAISLEMQPDLLENVEVKHYPTSYDAMQAVQNGEVDAAYVLPFTAQMFITREPGNSLFYTMLDGNGASFKMYVPTEDEHELFTILKKVIKRMPAGTINQLGASYVSYNANEMSLLYYLHANPEILIGSALAIILAASIIFIMWMRGRWNRRLLATTARANQELSGQLAIVEALSRDYTNVLAINGDNGNTRIVKISDYGVAGQPSTLEEENAYEHILDSTIKKKVHPDDREYVAGALSLVHVRRQLADKDEYSGTYRSLDKDTVHHFQFTFVRPNSPGLEDDNLILAGFRNIDEVIRREHKQKAALAKALAKSRYASAAKTAFLNNMSHDIRTPMNAIIGFTALASENVKNIPLVRRYLGKIMTSGNHLLSLINDVLDMSRIESGKVKLEDQEVSLPEILHDLRTIAQADVKAKNLEFRIDAINIENEAIICDKLRLNQVMLNILSNAIKYTLPGGKVSVTVIQVTPAINGHAVYEFRIADTGIGMSKEFLEHVFEPFEREQTTTVSGIQGTGLGLAITKNIVDMLEGTIEVQSESGKGSEFIVTFRFKVPEQQPVCLPQVGGKSALIVEGEDVISASLDRMLSGLDIRTEIVTTGNDALTAAKKAEGDNAPYEIFIVATSLADMPGLNLARRLREHFPAASIIVLADQDWADMDEEGKDAGITAFCSKPVFLSDLCKILSGETREEQKDEAHIVESEIFSGKRILLAEDNEMNQEIAQMILENAGFELEIVENGKLAVDKMRDMPAHTYDLILMDVQMPVMNGYDATRGIRALAEPEKANIPIIAMTANAFEEDREEALKSGMNGYVAKPIDIQKLLEALEEILRKQSS